MSTTAEKIAVMRAFERGDVVQRKYRMDDENPWCVDPCPSWNWVMFEYRVKPKPREVWVNIYPHTSKESTETCITHTSKESAEGCCGKGGETIHFREVTD